jgi:hypothetical protein
LILAVVLLAAAAIALAVAIQGDEGGPSTADLRASPALNAVPKTGRCLGPPGPGAEGDDGVEVERTAAQVEQVRKLEFRSPPNAELVSEEEIDATIDESVEESYPPALMEIDRRLLAALGAIPPDADLGELTRASLEGQVAGLYDPRTDLLLVARTGDDPGLLERVTLAHELEHALADQHFGLPTNEKADVSRTDALIAEAALFEGDASLVAEIYLTRYVSPGDLFGGLGSLVGELDDEAVAALPDYIQRAMTFPYVAGAEFVCALKRRGGWGAVDRAYRRPPETTAEIMFPERYGEPAADTPPTSGPGAAWKDAHTASFGAAELHWLLKAPGGNSERAIPRARAIAAAWAGGEVRMWIRGEETAVTVTLVPRPGEAELLCAGVGGWYSNSFPGSERAEGGGGERLSFDGDQDAVLRCAPDVVRLGIGPDLATARAAAS